MPVTLVDVLRTTRSDQRKIKGAGRDALVDDLTVQKQKFSGLPIHNEGEDK